jgi:hypothetical protein
LAASAKSAETAPASAEDLEAEESGNLPLPKRHTMNEGTTTPLRHELKASVPLALADVLGFYRREPGKRNCQGPGRPLVRPAVGQVQVFG